MRRVDALFSQYGDYHRNPVNKTIHWICVPLIVWSVLGMLWACSPLAVLGAIAGAMCVLPQDVTIARGGCPFSVVD